METLNNLEGDERPLIERLAEVVMVDLNAGTPVPDAELSLAEIAEYQKEIEAMRRQVHGNPFFSRTDRLIRGGASDSTAELEQAA